MTFEEWWENHLIAREFCGWEKGNAKAAAAAAWRDCGTMSAAMSAAEIATLKAEVKNLKEQVDWQNMPNRNPAARGGYEFYINEEWSCVKTVALGDGTGTIATLMKSRFDPDDDRVRVRLVKDDDALLDDLRKSELLLAESQAEAERLKVERATLRHLVCDLVDTMDLPHAIFSPPAIEAAQKIRAEEYGDTPEKQ